MKEKSDAVEAEKEEAKKREAFTVKGMESRIKQLEEQLRDALIRVTELEATSVTAKNEAMDAVEMLDAEKIVRAQMQRIATEQKEQFEQEVQELSQKLNYANLEISRSAIIIAELKSEVSKSSLIVKEYDAALSRFETLKVMYTTVEAELSAAEDTITQLLRNSDQ